MPDSELKDKAMFWLTLGGILVALAAGFGAVGAAEAIPAGVALADNSWFRAALLILALGALLLVRAIILQIAHEHVLTHWCPDPSVHKSRRTTPRTKPAATDQKIKSLETRVAQVEQKFDGLGVVENDEIQRPGGGGIP